MFLLADYLRLIRVKHYIKNLLIFAALLFSGQLLLLNKLRDCLIGFFVFCLISSAVYIVNDIKDKDKDRLHPQKCNRPIASNKITVKNAIITAIVCLILASVLFCLIFNVWALLFLFIYVVINIFYSFGLKNIPLLDVSILVAGFLIRVVYGAIITDIKVSGWLYLTVISISFFLSFGKRRNELKQIGNTGTREALKGYGIGFLERCMYMCLTMANTYYALWAMSNVNNVNNEKKVMTVPIVMLISLKYCLDIEKDTSDGDPTEVLLQDKILILLCLLYAVLIIGILYLDNTRGWIGL